MTAHIPNRGFITQLDVLTDCIEQRFDDLQSQIYPRDVGVQMQIQGLRLLWQTYQALSADFESVILNTIPAVSSLEARADISTQGANQLISLFQDVLGDAYVHTIAANTAQTIAESGA